MHISEVYATQLEDQLHGYPLWFPEGPKDSGDIEIGDVGYIRDGQFIELFKAKYARDDGHNARNLQRNRIPVTHEPLPEMAYSEIVKNEHYIEGETMCTSKSLKHREMKPSAGA